VTEPERHLTAADAEFLRRHSGAVARRMLSEGRGKAVIARTIGVSRPTLYAHLAAAVDVAEVVV